MLQNWEICTFVSYGIPTVLLHIFVLYQICFKHKFHSAFFKLSAVIGVVDLTNYVTIWLDLKLVLYPLTAFVYLQIEFKFIFVLLHFNRFYLSKVRELLILATAVNRFTALCFPHKQQKIWEKCLWPITFFCFGLPLLSSFHILLGEPKIIPFYDTPDNLIYVIDVTNIIKISNALINGIHTTIVSLLSLIFNILTFINLMLIRKNTTENGGMQKKYKAEKNLFIISAMDLGLDLISGLHQIFAYSYVVRNLHYDPFFDQLYLLYPWTYDIVNLTRPILLITVCQQMREAFIIAFWYSTKSKKPRDTTITVLTIM